ncbi:Acetyltransferase (GNAT) family protein [Rubrivivax sp. A210]|nr:Acetyltransferase (GNAT) family protein [Rubrivivax sp. A210]
MTLPVSTEVRLGNLSDQATIAEIDEFGGDRLAEIEAKCLFVATHQGVIVGYASYEPRGLLGQPLLTYLCVSKQHRRQGVATSLVRHVQSVAKGRKLISSTEDWCVGTQRIFERLGWAPVGTIAHVNKDGSTELFYAVAIDA